MFRRFRTHAFIAAGILGVMGFCIGLVYAIESPSDEKIKSLFLFGMMLLCFLWIFSVIVLGVAEAQLARKRRKAEKQRGRKQRQREQHRDEEMRQLIQSREQPAIAPETQPPPVELPPPSASIPAVVGEAHSAQSPQPGNASGDSRTIAEEVKAGRPLLRFELDKTQSLREAGLHLAKLYRDFANKPTEDADIQSGKYLVDFWREFPFREFATLKDRMKDVLGFEVSSATDDIPSAPERIKRLAKRLEKEALKVPGDVPL